MSEEALGRAKEALDREQTATLRLARESGLSVPKNRHRANMTYNRLHARALLNATELVLFEHSVGDALTGSSAAQLTQRLKRAGTLRDKYRDLLRRQKLATRARTGSKSGASGDANARTEQKVKLFEEVLHRLGAQRSKLSAADDRGVQKALAASASPEVAERPVQQGRVAPPAKRPAIGQRKTSGVIAKGKKTAGPASEKANAAAQRSQLASARTKVIQTHIASRGRRQQAVRDKR